MSLLRCHIDLMKAAKEIRLPNHSRCSDCFRDTYGGLSVPGRILQCMRIKPCFTPASTGLEAAYSGEPRTEQYVRKP